MNLLKSLIETHDELNALFPDKRVTISANASDILLDSPPCIALRVCLMPLFEDDCELIATAETYEDLLAKCRAFAGATQPNNNPAPEAS